MTITEILQRYQRFWKQKRWVCLLIFAVIILSTFFDRSGISYLFLVAYVILISIATNKQITPAITRYSYEKNAELEDKRRKIEKLLLLANEEIKIVAGRLNSRVYGYKAIEKAIEKALNKGVNIEIIVDDDDLDNNSKEIMKWISENKITLYRLQRGRVSNHFIVVDREHIRIEEPHESETKETDMISRYWYASKPIGEKTIKKFDQFKNLCLT
jgi:hypothetical protein